jgi:metal-responsive CopG/Arc/MetJ family transcriptional regulator
MGKGRCFSEDKKIAISVALRFSTLTLLNQLAAQRNVSRSELIENALLKTLHEQKEGAECTQ